MKLSIKVIPGASRNQVVGWLGDSLKVAVTAPAQAGKANKAVKGLLAEFFKVEKNSIEIIGGYTSARKIVQFDEAHKNKILSKLHHPALHKE